MEIRHCVRQGCSRAAAASLSYDYRARTAWIDELPPATEPHRYDLCAPHADGMRLPVGWELIDSRRSYAPDVLFRAAAS
jgi:hypothetical protein